MITAYYTRTDKKIELDVSGHAGAGKKGEDIICAGVSALMDTLEAVAELDKWQAEIERGEGKSRVTVRDTQDSRKLAVFDAIFTGIDVMSEQFPEFVTCEMLEGQHPWAS